MWNRVLLLVLTGLLAVGITVHPAQAKDYPSQTIELVCPYSAGGAFDLYSRLVAQILPKYLGGSMIVINKTGGGGSVAAADTISSQADGYKILIMDQVYFSTAVKTQKIPFNPFDLVPLNTFLEMRTGLVVRADAPWKNLDEALTYAKQNKGKFRFGHPTRGMPPYLCTKSMFDKVGATMIDIPYKGAPESITALLGGHLDAIGWPHGAVASQIKGGAMRYLVLYSDRRYDDLPGVPCAKELGFDKTAILGHSLLCSYVRKDTPQEIKTAIINAFSKASEDPAFKDGIKTIGDVPYYLSDERTLEIIREQSEVSTPILKELGLYVGN